MKTLHPPPGAKPDPQTGPWAGPGEDPEARRLSGLMFEAIYLDKADEVERLYHAGALSVPLRDSDPARAHQSWDPLVWAAFEMGIESLRALLRLGWDPNAVSDGDSQAIHFAAQADDNGEMTRALLEAGANPKALGERGETPLHRAIFPGNENSALALIAAGADVNAKDHFGETPLGEAALEASEGLLRVFLSHGADPMAPATLNHGKRVTVGEKIAMRPGFAQAIDLRLQLKSIEDRRALEGASPGKASKPSPRV